MGQQYHYPNHVERRGYLPQESLPLPDRGAERPVYRIVSAGIGNPVVATGQLQNYGFVHNQRRQLDSQPKNNGVNRAPAMVSDVVVHSRLCRPYLYNNHRNFPQNAET